MMQATLTAQARPGVTPERKTTRTPDRAAAPNPVSATSDAAINAAWLETADALAATFGKRATQTDDEGAFVAENYRDLREQGLFWSFIPKEHGGGGADYRTLCRIVRTLGTQCGSTGLSFAMHAHPAMVNVYKAMRNDARGIATVAKLATKRLVIAGTGANDWLQSSGEATPVEGGYEVTAHKRFVSGGPGADVFVTSCVVVDEDKSDAPSQVIHFAIPFKTEGIAIQNNWNTLGMRGTGSNDVLMEKVFVPESAVALKRAAGEWHPMWDVILPVALPIIVSCYVGIAARAVELATRAARGKDYLASDLGALRNAFTIAELAAADMVTLADNLAFTPDIAISDAILARKAIATRAITDTVEQAASIVGGAGFFKGHPMERIVRDVRAMHFHPLPEKRQQLFCGRRMLGLSPV